MLSSKSTGAKSDATRTNTARGAVHTATDRHANAATVRSRAKARAKAGQETVEADAEKGVKGDGPRHEADHNAFLNPPSPPAAPIPVAASPETVTAGDVATQAAVKEVEEESSDSERKTIEKRIKTARRNMAGHLDHDRFECLMHCAAAILSGSITRGPAEAAKMAVALETEVVKAIDEDEQRLEAEAETEKEAEKEAKKATK